MENATATIVPSALFLTLKGKRITRATFKSFVTKNRTNLLIKVTSKFDGMQDMVDSTGEKDFVPVRERDSNADNTLGIQGVWLVNGPMLFADSSLWRLKLSTAAHSSYPS